MSIHYGLLSSSKTSSTDLSDLEKKVADVKKTADTNKSTIAVHDVTVRANEKDLVLVNKAITANTSSINTNTSNITTVSQRSILTKTRSLANETSITTNSNYIQTNKTDILDAITKANTNKASIDELKKSFAYHFSFYYVNLAYNTWHSPEIIKLGWNAPWLYFDEPTENTKVKLMGQSFNDDSAIHTRSRIKMEYKVLISKTDNSTEEVQLYYDNILSKKLSGKNFYINEEKSLKDMFPSTYRNAIKSLTN